ncbi:hypothetical protein T10_11905 [Trichinella papuae]|uniref:Uncharacterized protein n=1 Tax=Trichinella papuae TaxID=268474 RepID=A0A0V1MRB3_9BILA|nr:hypothetical protein T10_11905 [Trichinella papuae]
MSHICLYQWVLVSFLFDTCSFWIKRIRANFALTNIDFSPQTRQFLAILLKGENASYPYCIVHLDFLPFRHKRKYTRNLSLILHISRMKQCLQ